MKCFRSTTLCQRMVISAVLVSASLTCSAQKLKGIDQDPASPSHVSVKQMLHLGAANPRPMRSAVGTPVHSEPQALPHWSGSFKYTTGANRTATTQTYPYTMVGSSPSTKGASATTTIRTILVPLRVEFADGTVLDASTDTLDPLNTSVVNNVLASPLFTPSPVYAGTVNLGNTQWADAMQRGNLWNQVSTNPDYHVLLKPEVYPTQTIVVPAALGLVETDFFSGILVGTVYQDPNNSNKSPIDTAVASVVAQIQDPSALVIFLSHNVFNSRGAGAAGGASYHDVLPLAGGMEQTYIFASYLNEELFINDIQFLSEEVSEWLDDPFGDNIVPPWGTCSSTSLLEVGDPIVFIGYEVLAQVVNGVAFHPQDFVFLPWFEKASTSTSVNGWYTFANFTTGPDICTTSGDYNYTTLDFPGGRSTRAIGVNNQGTVAGRYVGTGAYHGFLYKNGQYTSLDVPGARWTLPQGINDQGQVVGNMYDSSGSPHGFSYGAGVFQQIDFPGALYTQVYGINNSGVIVGLYGDANNFTPYGYNLIHAFQLSKGIFSTIDAPPFAYESYAYSINNAGKMSGGYDLGGDQFENYAFVGAPGDSAPFTLPGASAGTESQTIPFGLNNQNDVVGIYFEAGNPYNYAPQGFVSYGQTKTWLKLDAPGAWYTDLYGINDKGTIVGDYQDDTGIHGVVLTTAGK